MDSTNKRPNDKSRNDYCKYKAYRSGDGAENATFES